MTDTETVQSRVILIPIDKVQIGPRHREQSDPGELQESIRRVGLLNPITVTSDWWLIAGKHRLQACQALGHEAIAAIAMPYASGTLEAELAEIDENFRRHNLTALESGEHAIRRAEILRQMGLRQEVGRPATTNQNGATVAPFQEATTTADLAREAGVSERTIQVHMQVARDLPDDVRAQLRPTGFANRTGELLALSRQPENTQREIAAVISAGAADTVSKALRILQQPDGDDPDAIPEDEDIPDDPGADINERLRPVRVRVTIWHYQESDRPRVRYYNGERRETMREGDPDAEREVNLNVSCEALEGDTGLRLLVQTLAHRAYQTLHYEGWPRKRRQWVE